MRVRLAGLSLLPASARRPALLKRACLQAWRSAGPQARSPRAARAAGRAPDGELSLVFLDRRRMREMNRRFLGHDYDTDVISFSYPRPRRNAGDSPFGDVFVSAHMARRQAKSLGHSVLTEVLTLAVHGTLHLLGYTDASSLQKARMFRRQGSIVRRVHGKGKA